MPAPNSESWKKLAKSRPLVALKEAWWKKPIDIQHYALSGTAAEDAPLSSSSGDAMQIDPNSTDSSLQLQYKVTILEGGIEEDDELHPLLRHKEYDKALNFILNTAKIISAVGVIILGQPGIG